MKYSEDMKAYLNEVKPEPESTSCTVVRSSVFTQKSGLLNEETLSLIRSPKYLADMGACPNEGFVLLNPAV